MSESARRQYRKFLAQQKSELVLVAARAETIAELCPEHDIARSPSARAAPRETLLRRWRGQFLAAGAKCSAP